ncbi:uncharacterized protein B0P05DRAFT_536403 [Gilbertella persicaria]|uniref:uncharacterized protein n=1 Tax=Gilbertella persicaria TaxID=101096 RepID=UPI00221F3A7F|nr:uncharacterized protein B0P05DRAFT_536403 [Gilbertella persicaria]KAI8084171.1 hypothetical protein B0P05DRAFT_536403 [Gilbertella persicaria]
MLNGYKKGHLAVFEPFKFRDYFVSIWIVWAPFACYSCLYLQSLIRPEIVIPCT